MLQSEFYDRTGVTLTAEEYGDVENIYNRVQMDKDQFCKLWLNNRDNQIIKELVQTCMTLERKNAALEGANANFESTIAKEREKYGEKMKNFAAKVLTNLGDESRIYDAIEEEFTLDFIVRVKLENDLELEEHERKHLLTKL